MTPPLSLTMIGTGYVGLVSGTCFAELGFNVTCVDVDKAKIEALNSKGEIPIFEPGLEQLVKRNVEAGRLTFTTDLAEAVPTADAVFIAVGTPQEEDGSADLQYVEAAARDIAPHLQGYTVIVNKSTVPVGTGARVEEIVRESNASTDFDVASNPEFLREGEAVGDFLNPDRVVIGIQSGRAEELLRTLYQPLTSKGATLHVTNRASAELIKYAANAFLATKITFINELISLCDAVGADILSVSRGMGLDTRIAPRFLQPGPGYGGSCFPKDTHALAKTARDNGLELALVETTIRRNTELKQEMAQRILSAMGEEVKSKTIAVLGLAFKANTDDMRDASSLTIVPALARAGASIRAYDPEAMAQAKRHLPDITYAESTSDAINGADAVVILTDWEEFKTLELAKLAAACPLVVDLRNLFEPAAARAAGLTYHPLGRP